MLDFENESLVYVSMYLNEINNYTHFFCSGYVVSIAFIMLKNYYLTVNFVHVLYINEYYCLLNNII